MRAPVISRLVLLAVFATVGLNRAQAEIIFHEDNISTDENLQFNDGLEGGPAIKIQGLTNTSATLVDISRIDPAPFLLVKGAAGAARVEATNPIATALFSGALFETPGNAFTAFEFNLNLGRSQSGLLTILAKDLDGITHTSALQLGFNGAVGNGENRFGVTADGGMKLVGVTVELNGTIVSDIRQVRLGGITPITSVPEPAAIVLSLFSLAAFGLFSRSRYSRRTA